MKKILVFLVLLISLKSFGQYPVNQSLGSDSTLVTSKGGMKSRFINKPFQDTTQANLQRIKFYDGSQLYTNSAGGQLWLRDSILNKWVLIGGAGFTSALNGTSVNGTIVELGGVGSPLTKHTVIPLNGFPLTINHNGVDSTAQSDSNTLRFTNNTAATGITSAVTSPGIMFKTSGWRTSGSTAKDQRYMIDATGLSTTAINGNSLFRIRANPNNVGYSTIFSISAAGVIQQNLNVNGAFFGNITTGTGSNNLKVGDLTLMSITTGSTNVAVGSEVLQNHKTGDDNTAVGYAAMISDTSGADNTAMGSRALFTNKNGSQNTAVGRSAMATQSTGSNNTAVGYSALAGFNTANSNTAIGHSAMLGNTSGNLNTAVGGSAMLGNTTGAQNAAFGYNSLRANTTAIKNTAVGTAALEETTTGGFNTAMGHDVMLHNITGINNTAVGHLSGATATAGNGNVSLGYIAGTTFTSGDNNIWIGNQAGTHASQTLTPTNSIAIGYNSFTTASNQIVIGNSSHTTAKFFGIPSGVGTKAVRYDPSTNELTYGDTTSGSGSGSGTVNTGAANKATYYPSAGTTVDDFIGVEYGLTNNTMRLLPQAVGDTALVLRAKASQTAPLLWTQDAAGAGQFKIWENGYISNAIYKAYPVEFHANVGGVFGRFGTQFAFSNAPENSQVGYGIFGRADASEIGLYKYDATGGISMYLNGIVTPRFYLAAATGNVGIGTGTTVSARLHSLSTTEQLRLGYDASNYLSTTIGSTGGTTFDAIGAGSAFTFSDRVSISTTSTTNVLSTGGTLTPGAGNPGFITSLGGTITEAGSGTHSILAGTSILAPVITDGAGATTDATSLYISGPATGITPANAATSFFIASGNVRWGGYGAGTATFDGSGNITSVSDRRAKHDIRPFTLGLREIKNLHPSSFIYNNDRSGAVMQGFIAQDVRKAFYGQGVYSKIEDGKESMLSLNTNAILAAAVNAIKELSKRVEYLEKELKKYKK